MIPFNKASCAAAALALAAGLAVASPRIAGAEEMKIGYVNFESIFEKYEKTKEQNEALQKRKYEKEVEGQKLVDDINKLRNEMQLLSDDAKEEKQKELTEKMRKLRDFTNDSKEELLKARDILFKELSKEIMVIIEQKGKEDGYTLIFDDNMLLYKAKANDLTQDVLKLLNEKYKKGSADATKEPTKPAASQ